MTLRRAFVLIAIEAAIVLFAALFIAKQTVPFAPSAVNFGALGVAALFGGGLLVFLGSVKQGWGSFRQLGWRVEGWPSQVAFGLLGAGACVGFLVGLLLVLGVPASVILAQLKGYSMPERALFACIGVQAAFIEESLFRGNLQPLLIKRFGPWVAVPVTALVFALYHLTPSPMALASKMAIGLILGGLALAIAHAVSWVVVGTL